MDVGTVFRYLVLAGVSGQALGGYVMNPNDSTNRRLLLAKYLYSRGSTALRGGGIFDAAIAVSSFHDAIELALVAVTDRFGGGRPTKGGFIDLWDSASGAAVEKGTKKALPLRSEMIAMNEARIGFKHLGNRVTAGDGKGYRLSTEQILVFITTEYFGLSFSELTLASYVQVREERTLLEDAIATLHAGDKKGALNRCAEALKLMHERASGFFRHGWLVSYAGTGKDPAVNEAVSFTKAQIGHLKKYVRHVESLVMAGLYGVAPMDFSLVDSMLKSTGGDLPEVDDFPDELIVKTVEILALYSIGMSDRHNQLDTTFATNLSGTRN